MEHGFIVQLLTIALFFQYVKCQSSIQWVARTPNQIMRSGMEPAGLENGQKTFLCRLANGVDNYSIGTISLAANNSDQLHCKIRTDPIVVPMPMFEILEYPPDTLSWMPWENRYFDTAVGSSFNGRTTYVCRGNVPGLNNAVSVGFVDRDLSLSCQLIIQRTINSTTNFDLLVVNLNGQRLGMVAPKN